MHQAHKIKGKLKDQKEEKKKNKEPKSEWFKKAKQNMNTSLKY